MEQKLPKPDAGRDWIFTASDSLALVELFVANRAAVRHLLNHRHVLTPAQRTVFDLYYNDGLSQHAIAERLDMRRNTVDEHLKRARARIRRAMKKEESSAAERSEGAGPPRFVAPI